MGGWGAPPQRPGGGHGGGAPGGGVAPGLSTVGAPAYGLSKEFAADNPIRMPSASDSSLLAAAQLRRNLIAASGRDSTRLVGTQVYGNTFLGSVN